MTQTMTKESTIQFREAIALAIENRPTEALTEFRGIVERFPQDDLADDALYNMGACYLAMNQYGSAAETFERLIAEYPEATIAEDENGGRETGRTAAKAWLGLLSARLGLGDLAGARQACTSLEGFEDSKLRPAPGIERSFHDIAESLLLAVEGHAEDSADEVCPEDMSADGAQAD